MSNRNSSTEREPTSRPKPSIQLITPQTYKLLPWKNGLGETCEIAEYPKKLEYGHGGFTWRLSLATVTSTCSFSLFPGYDIAVIALPENINDFGTCAVLRHNDDENSIALKPLRTYSYDGGVPTTCTIKGPPKRFLNFIANRKWANVSINMEVVSMLDDESESQPLNNTQTKEVNITKKSNVEKSAPSSKMLLSNFTIIYVVSGSINVSIYNNQEEKTVLENQTLVCERLDTSLPTDISMSPISPDGSATASDAIVLLIQVNIVRYESVPSLLDLSLPEMKPMSVTRPRNRASSIVIYDEQPQNWKNDQSRGPLESQISLMDISSPQMDAIATNNGPANQNWDSARHYKPGLFISTYKNESDVPPPVIKDSLVIEDFPIGQISTAWINMFKQGLSEWIRIPVIVARGKEPGPVVGITAVVHGNELNGVPCIHLVIAEIDVSQLSGTVVAVPCVNVPGYLRFDREFPDGKDLNRMFPGKDNGFASSMYCYNLMNKIINKFDYLIDLHTASFGRINSYYVRSDMNDPVSATLAKLQQPQIILHNSGQDGTLRSAATALGIKAITVEIGNPQLIQNRYVQWSYMGVMRILSYLSMFTTESELNLPPNMVLCSQGFWIYTKTGGVLEVYPSVNMIVRKGDLIARLKNIFGNIVDEIYAPRTGITIGRSSNPVAMAGDRVLHLGVIKKENEVLAKEAKENY